MSVRPYPLDRIDQKILELLKSDGRITYQRLAELVHLTPRPTQERVRKLEKAGVIRGYTALIDSALVSPGMVIHAQITLASQAGRTAQEAFETEMKRLPQVLDCHLVSGTFDYLVRLACKDLDDYHALTNAWLESPAFRLEKIVGSPELQTVKRTV
jgi:Lrp/AsnC family leucine-responsive transcriptional regulator